MSTSDHNNENRIADEAVTWHLRLRDNSATADDWDAFTEWLEQSPAHASAYQSVRLADDTASSLKPDDIDINAGEPIEERATVGRRGFFGGAAIAAALAVALMFWPFGREFAFEEIRTAAGETRSISLDDGLTIEINGGTHLEVSAKTNRVRVLEGEAAFYIEQPPSPSLRVDVGELTLVDKGTVFNVIKDKRSIRVGVAEGEIIIDPSDDRMSIGAGEAIQILNGGRLERRRIAPEAVVAWRSDQLVFADTPAQIVASDIGRNLGVTITVDEQVSQQKLSGVVQTTGDKDAVINEVAALLGGRAVRSNDGWLVASN
ncbi:FecR family protein [Qipengyuania sp.]|uniref:FecR family protein n=1 Tax=Qipengyuania sp. TaxID=2004515 RepID=UPI003BAB4F2C